MNVARAQVLLVAVGGACFGAAVALFAAQRVAPAVGSSPVASVGVATGTAAALATGPKVVHVHGGPDDARIAALEAKVAALSSAAATAKSGADGDGPSPLATLTPEQLAAASRAEVDAKLAAHSAEPIDKAWSAGAEKAYALDLVAVEKASKATVLGLRCRSTTCKAELEWATYDEARAGLREVTGADYVMNCARTVALDPDAKPGGKVHAVALFDCASLKYGEGS